MGKCSLSLPSLNKDFIIIIIILNGKIQLDEVEKALGRIRKGKASGIDRIPIELYSSEI